MSSPSIPVPTAALSEVVRLRSYARWLPEKGRRETWAETVQRYVNYMRGTPGAMHVDMDAIQKAILNREVMPSMRALWAAGPALDRCNVSAYNCAFLPIDNMRAPAEALYILMSGCGCGFSVEREFVDALPEVPGAFSDFGTMAIPDTTEGWCDVLYWTIRTLYQGCDVGWDFTHIRPAGATLKTKGGRASGPEPLKRLLKFVRKTILAASGRKLTSLEWHDILCMVGEITMAGGVRRAALISISDVDDEAMRHAKDWSKGPFPEHRYMANNSLNAWGMTRPEFEREWSALVQSGSGERGLYFPKAKDLRPNPCGEIDLRFRRATDPWTGAGGGGQFCNLSAVVLTSRDTVLSLREKVRIATQIGMLQAQLTDFQYLRPAWRDLCIEDNLLGVDITGQADNPALMADDLAIRNVNLTARITASDLAMKMRVAVPRAITCGKPSGNSSQFLGCSSGFHVRYAPYYLRRVRMSATDPLLWMLQDQGLKAVKDTRFRDTPDEDCPTWVIEFPVKSPAGAIVRSQETALQSLQRYLSVRKSWLHAAGHNQSCTIYVRDHEWDAVRDWVWAHKDEIGGLSFLPYDGGQYELAPYQEITAPEYAALAATFPALDFEALSRYERMDQGDGARELACVGGACEI